jgi:hypothetical protein
MVKFEASQTSSWMIYDVSVNFNFKTTAGRNFAGKPLSEVGTGLLMVMMNH